jgi:Lon protease-like protein
MQEDLLPLFPLAVVLLPRNQLPLHIFEDRYKEMIALVLERKMEFGVVLTAGEGIASTGCTAAVEQVVNQYPDGRMDILAVGLHRFVIRELNQDRDYLRGAVDYFDDNDSSSPLDLRRRAAKMCSRIPGPAEPDIEDPQLSFQLAGRIADLEFRQQLLSMRSEAGRLRKLVDFVPAYLQRVTQVERLKELAPKNGHGKPPANLTE